MSATPRLFRAIMQGFRRVGPHVCPSGVRLEEYVSPGYWLYVDVLPDYPSCEQYVVNCKGTIKLA